MVGDRLGDFSRFMGNPPNAVIRWRNAGRAARAGRLAAAPSSVAGDSAHILSVRMGMCE